MKEILLEGANNMNNRLKVLIALALSMVFLFGFSQSPLAEDDSIYSDPIFTDPVEVQPILDAPIENELNAGGSALPIDPDVGAPIDGELTPADPNNNESTEIELTPVDPNDNDPTEIEPTPADPNNNVPAEVEPTPTDPNNSNPIEVKKQKKYLNGYAINGRLMVPIRNISETLGLYVTYENGRLKVGNFVSTLEFIPGSKKYFLNGNELISESETITHGGQNYVPLAVLTKSFDIPYFHNQLSNWVEISQEKVDLYIYIKPETSMYKHNPKEVVSLMYHHFQEGSANGVIISPTRFREHIIALKAQGYETITEQDYLNYQQGKTKLPLKPLLITIDDGYRSNYLEAFPILAEEGYKATVYLTTSKAESKPGYVEYMSWAEMKEMVDSGVMDIQSHTHDLHYQLPKTGTNRGYALVDKLPTETYETWKTRIKEDMRLSKQLIEQNLGNKVYAFAYPYGVYNEAVINMLKQEGYQIAFTITKGKNTISNSAMTLKRYTADGRFTAEVLVSNIK